MNKLPTPPTPCVDNGIKSENRISDILEAKFVWKQRVSIVNEKYKWTSRAVVGE
jgi:hypothetical protein